MAQTIQLKRSSVAGNLPTSSDLALGEIAINTADGAVYIKKGNDDIVIVFGAEGKGIRRLTKEYCDMLLSIDGNHAFSSLNVSTAVGITLFNIQSNKLYDV